MIFNLKDGVNPKVNLKVFLLNFLISLQLFILLQLIFIPGCPKIVVYHYYQLAAYLHVEANKLLPECQSGFREGHSTETLLLRLLSDIYEAVDCSQLTLLALFDVSAAFDTVDHKILLKRLNVSFGFSGTLLLWLRSFLTERSLCVVHGSSRSSWVPAPFGLPQGSVLAP